MRSSATGVVLAAIVAFVVGCAAGTPRTDQAGDARIDAGRRADQSRTLVMTTRAEPDTIAAKEVMSVTGLSFDATPRIFNAGLAILDAREAPLPYLVETHPQLNTDTWRVLPDGRMETTYRLRPNLRWHDGTALSSHDFAFAWRVYSSPELGQATTPPISQMEEVVAVDDRTVVIRWRSSYPNADALEAEDFQPLPRHILGDAYQPEQIENFGRLLFWTTEYVGLGPYRLDRWQPGASLEAIAFDGHAWGRPKIDRWVGGNRSGWSNVEYDRLFDAYNSTLDRSQRNQHMIRMAQLFTEDAAALSLFFNPGIVAHVAALHGPMPFAPAADVAWNIHEWEWR